MVCYNPLAGYYAAKKNPNGKRSIVFDVRKALSPSVLPVPCGRCVGCKLERARQWAVRCMHEKKMHDYSSFVTLTYADDKIPHGGTLVKRDLQLFMKRLRKEFGRGIRFYGCGEYGDGTKRPHYHVLLFNVRFPDMVRVATGKTGAPLYSSRNLASIWQHGHCFIGEVTEESCAYVARYILKKVTGKHAETYREVMTAYGEVIVREPEFTVMSRRPGIGAGWFDKYHSEVYAYDSVISKGMEAKPPRFYDSRFELLDLIRMETIKRNRRRRALEPNRRADNTKARLRTREVVELRKLAFYAKRAYL